MPRQPIPDHLLTEKQKKLRNQRQKYKKYFANYSKYYYLKKILENPHYNQIRWKKTKKNSQNNKLKSEQ